MPGYFFKPLKLKEPEYRGFIINTRREGDHWVAHWALPDRSTPEYRHPNPRPKVVGPGVAVAEKRSRGCIPQICIYSGGFLHGPYRSRAQAYAAAKRKVDDNIIKS